MPRAVQNPERRASHTTTTPTIAAVSPITRNRPGSRLAAAESARRMVAGKPAKRSPSMARIKPRAATKLRIQAADQEIMVHCPWERGVQAIVQQSLPAEASPPAHWARRPGR